MGHARNYVPTDVLARYLRMCGFAVLHPMGWDAFGLPAENEALLRGRHPRATTEEYAATYRRQLRLLGCSYDWSRELSTSDPGFVRGTQWGFLLLYRRGLVYRASGWQWWCPKCRTILANEQVEHGRCWRHADTLVERRALAQWYVRTTAYADRLVADLDRVDWPERIKVMQRNWVGRADGADVRFPVDGAGDAITVFTTRPETIQGATFVALAPDHPVASSIASASNHAVQAFIEAARQRADVDRAAARDGPAGVFTGAWARHPLTGARLPVFVADYVLAHHGTGAIMGVPACDERDALFAARYGLGAGPVPEDAGARERVMSALAAGGAVSRTVRYRMRDWLISRQRYWGAPIPLVHCSGCGTVPVSEDDLPVLLPEVPRYEPSGTGRSPLAGIESFVRTACPRCRGPAERETDTLDGFADSNWYFLRFADPDASGPWSPEAVRYWLPVDWYVGGAEQAVMHLLFARFFTKVLFDAGLVSFDEPFARLRTQGSMLSPQDGARMSKSRGNVVTPDEVVESHGADALRMGVLFLGPFDHDVRWDPAVLQGAARFVRRLHALIQRHAARRDEVREPRRGHGTDDQSGEISARLAQVISGAEDAIEHFRFNTLVSDLMTFLSDLETWEPPRCGTAEWANVLRATVRLVAPVIPFVAEEAWAMLGGEESVHRAPWPVAPPDAQDSPQPVTVVVQVDGRVRGRLRTVPGTSREELIRQARGAPAVRAALQGRQVSNVVYVSGRILNFVTATGPSRPSP